MILNTNVLNVVEKSIRDQIVRDIAKHLNRGGVALITTRGWTGDVENVKNREEAEEKHAIYVLKGDKRVFQKGFEQTELVEYIQGILGSAYKVDKPKGASFGKACAIVRAA